MMMFGEQLYQYSEQLYLMQTIAFNAMLGLRKKFHESLFTSLDATQILHTSSVKLVQDTLTFKAR